MNKNWLLLILCMILILPSVSAVELWNGSNQAGTLVNADDAGWVDYTTRSYIGNSNFSYFNASADTINITVWGGAGGFSWTAMSICEYSAGTDAVCVAGTRKNITYGGLTTGYTGSFGINTSDDLTFTISTTKTYLVNIDVGSNAAQDDFHKFSGSTVYPTFRVKVGDCANLDTCAALGSGGTVVTEPVYRISGRNASIAYPIIQNATWNFTTALAGQNTTAWRDGNNAVPIQTVDQTPTVTFTTDINAYCRINSTDVNYSAMGVGRNCTTTGTTNHTCTLAAADLLFMESINQYIYISCVDALNLLDYNITSTSGLLNITVLSQTQTSAGIFNESLLNITNLTKQEGKEFKPFIYWNYTDGTVVDNSSGNMCLLNISNVSREHYTVGAANTTVCDNVACSSTNYTKEYTVDTDVFNQDTIRVRLCKNSAASSDARLLMHCGDNQSYSQILAASMPLCGAGYVNYSIDTVNCSGEGYSVNVTFWSLGNTLAKGMTIVNDLLGFDRFRDVVNQNMTWNGTNGAWQALFFYEYYIYGYHYANMTCQSNNLLTNSSVNLLFYVNDRPPRIFVDEIYDYHNSYQLFTNLITANYPLTGTTLNITGGCEDENMFNAGIMLYYDNGTLIDSRILTATAGVVPSNVEYTQSNFTVLDVFLDGTRYYIFSAYCNDTTANRSNINRSFYAIDERPTITWTNATPSTISTIPAILNFTCSDPEGQTTYGTIFVNGTINTTGANLTGFVFNDALGSYNISVTCNDSIRSSTVEELYLTYSTICLPVVTGLVSGSRYIGLEHELFVNCSNGVGLSACFWSVNKYAENEVMPCNASFNVSLENGKNDFVLIINDASGFNTTRTLYLWAKDADADVFGFVLLWLFVVMMIVLFVLAEQTGVLIFGLFGGFVGLLVGYEVLAISWSAGVILMILLPVAGVVYVITRNSG